jgi:diguanylate cyclase (GGDEF)-like protein/PAS domain S-box-containing protein
MTTNIEDRGPIEHFFINARTSKFFSIVNLTSVIYCIVLISTFAGVYSKMSNTIIAIHYVGMSIIIANLFVLYKTDNVPRAAGVLLFCMLSIHLVNITIVGGINNPHFAWIFIFPILAGGTLGWRGQLFFYAFCLLGTIYFAAFPDSSNVLTTNGDLAYTVFTRIMCLTVFTLIMLVYFFTLNEKMRHLQSALDNASFQSELFLGVFNSKTQSVLMINQEGLIERANAKAHEVFGFDDGEVVNLPLSKLCQTGFEALTEMGSSNESTERKVTTNLGQTIWLNSSVVTILDQHKKRYFLCTLEDITLRKNHEYELSYLARYDYLTRLPNRLSLQEKLHEEIEKAKSRSHQLAVVFFDLDKFKNVNDIQGHQAGDTVLVKVAQRLQSLRKENDFVSRFGGDEFVLLMTSVVSSQQVIEQVQSIQDSISQTIRDAGNEYFVDSSAGIAFYPQDAKSADELIQKADIAMYKAKSNGRGQYQFYSLEHDESIKRQIQLGSELGFAIERDELQLLFQPIYDKQGKICSTEALVRWKHDEFGQISPDEFIPISEDNGLIVPIGSWVLEESCKALKAWHQKGFEGLSVSVNISYRQINHNDMVDEVKRILQKYQLDGSALILELTERVFADNLELVQRNIVEFEKMGVQTAIDDFGVGYSSLSYLKETTFSALKIDRSFIQDIEHDIASQKLCAAVASMAKSLGLSVTAEGVETQAHWEILSAMDIDKYQGYLMSKPIAFDEFCGVLLEQGFKHEDDEVIL